MSVKKEIIDQGGRGRLHPLSCFNKCLGDIDFLSGKVPVIIMFSPRFLDYVTSVDLWSDINCHGMTTSTHPSPVKSSFSL